MANHESHRNFSRRKFLGKASLAGTALISNRALGAQGIIGSGDRISIGMIGCGARGSAIMEEIQVHTQKKNCQITAVCDVWQKNLARAASRTNEWIGKKPRTFTRFDEVLALDDIDAVVIATPDFAHCPIMIAALEAGKDVYCEKPMAMDVENANRAFDLARAKGRVVQVGTQRRSDGHYPAAAETLATGVLGKISRVSVGNFFNHARWAIDYSNCVAADVDWEAYLFNRPKQPFDPRLLRRWQLFKMFTNGLAGLWMAHHVDACHLLTGSTYPTSAVAHGGTYVWKEDREHCDTFHALLDYPEGFLFDWAMGLGNEVGRHYTIHGTKGLLDVDTWTLSARGGKNTSVKKQKIEPKPGDDHIGNWLTCIRSRERPVADIQYGHQHAVASIMAAKAQETGLRQVYNRGRRKVVAG